MRALLGLGGNVGDVPATLSAALRMIDARAGTRVLAVSRLFRTPPWGVTDQPWFYNACAEIETELSPRGLLDLCLETERVFLRERRERWGPRTLDLDVLDCEGREYEDEALTLPHPRVAERAFVLIPLADIAPRARFSGRPVEELVRAVSAEGLEPGSPDGSWWRKDEGQKDAAGH